MNDDSKGRKGGFQIVASGGATVNVSPHGEFVGGDKISNSTTTNITTIEKGFASEDRKQEFQTQVEELREALRALKASVDQQEALSTDAKEEMVAEILKHVSALKEVKEKTALAPTGKAAPTDVAATVESVLDRAGGMVEKLKSVGDKTTAVAEAVGKLAVKYGPVITGLIASARHLFGLS